MSCYYCIHVHVAQNFQGLFIFVKVCFYNYVLILQVICISSLSHPIAETSNPVSTTVDTCVDADTGPTDSSSTDDTSSSMLIVVK